MGRKTKDEQFAFAKEHILDEISTWEDLYEMFDKLMGQVTETMHPGVVFNALFMMHGFMHAMRELPDEGDIKVLVERMLHIMIYEGEEKLGSEVTFMQIKDLKEVLEEQALKAITSAGLQQGPGAKLKH